MKSLSPAAWLLAVYFIAAAVPAVAEDSPVLSPSTGQLAKVMKPFIDKGVIVGGVALVADNKGVLDVETAGYSDREAKKPMATNTLFWIASMTKPINAMGLMILVDEGKINLDDPVSKYIPAFKDLTVQEDGEPAPHPAAHPLLVRQLLCHMTGFRKNEGGRVPFSERIKKFAAVPAEYEPGTHYHYHNMGPDTAARIIEIVSGMRYEDFMEQRLFTPLGMTDTTFWPEGGQLDRLSKSYIETASGVELRKQPMLHPVSERATSSPSAGSGLFSTASDLGKFCQMFLNGGEYKGKRILSEAAVRTMTTKQTPPNVRESYGLGWNTETTKDSGRRYGHGGSGGTNMNVYPDDHLVVIVLTQTESQHGHNEKETDANGFVPAVTMAAIKMFRPW